MKKALIFDMDGTLIDSMGIWRNLAYEYLQYKGIKNIPSNLADILSTHTVISASEVLKAMFELEESPEEITKNMAALMEMHFREDIELKDGVLDFLERHKSKKMCVATATMKDLAEIVLKRLGIIKYFDFVITTPEIGISKEKPDIYLMSASLLDEPVENCVVFEDAPHAIGSAKGAGFYVVGVHDEHIGDHELKEYCDEFVTNLCDVKLK